MEKLTREEIDLILVALLCTAWTSRENGHDEQAAQFHEIYDKIQKIKHEK